MRDSWPTARQFCLSRRELCRYSSSQSFGYLSVGLTTQLDSGRYFDGLALSLYCRL
jgi:hypothetical protein